MSNQYEHAGKHLVLSIARELILELFTGQSNVMKRDIISEIETVHKNRGGLEHDKETHPVTDALDSLKSKGLADNPKRGFWTIHGEFPPDNPPMNEATREKARIGLSLLKEAILDVLYEAQLKNDGCVKLKTVRESIDMPEGAKTGKPSDKWGSATTRFMLFLLQDDDKVQRCQLTEKTKGWQITETAYLEKHHERNKTP